MPRWFLRRGLPRIRSGVGQTSLTRPHLVDQVKADMLAGRYRYDSLEGQIAGWRNAAGMYFIGEGHHRVNAALEIARETGDRTHLDRLLEHGRWADLPPPQNRRLPTRSRWSRWLCRFGI